MGNEGTERERDEGVSRLVLIADGNTGRGQRLADACERAGLSCKTGPHGAAALEMALTERPGLVVAQVDLPLVDAPKLAEILRANPRTRRSRFLFLGDGAAGASGPGDVQMPEAADTAAIVRAIEELIGRQDRLDAVDRAAGGGQPVEGSLDLVSLADLLALFQANRATGRVSLEHSAAAGVERGVVLIRDGDVLQAECGSASNEKALFRLFAWGQGRFAFEPREIDEPAFIATSTRVLLQEGLRQLEEWQRLANKLPPLDSRVHMRITPGELPNVVHPLTQEVLLLLELYPTVREVVDHCSFPDYQVLRTLQTLANREIVEVGREPVAPTPVLEGEDEALFNEGQVRRVREWIEDGSPPRETLPAGKLLLVASDPTAMPDFLRLLGDVPCITLRPEAHGSALDPDFLGPVGCMDLGGGVRIDILQVPPFQSFSPLWALAGHRAVGTLFLLNGPVGDAAKAVSPVAEVFADLPRSRSFHVALLRKGERISPDELRENMKLVDEASLFLLPVESAKPATTLLRGLFTRIVP